MILTSKKVVFIKFLLSKRLHAFLFPLHASPIYHYAFLYIIMYSGHHHNIAILQYLLKLEVLHLMATPGGVVHILETQSGV